VGGSALSPETQGVAAGFGSCSVLVLLDVFREFKCQNAILDKIERLWKSNRINKYGVLYFLSRYYTQEQRMHIATRIRLVSH
jgi:hypothetical protein